jgi:hypothetical protein
MPFSRIECRGLVYSISDPLFDEILELAARELDHFLNTRGLERGHSFSWLKDAVGVWREELGGVPGLKLLWLDEFLLSTAHARDLTRFLGYLGSVVRSSYPPERIVTAEGITKVARFVKEAYRACIADGSHRALIEWRPRKETRNEAGST